MIDHTVENIRMQAGKAFNIYMLYLALFHEIQELAKYTPGDDILTWQYISYHENRIKHLEKDWEHIRNILKERKG